MVTRATHPAHAIVDQQFTFHAHQKYINLAYQTSHAHHAHQKLFLAHAIIIVVINLINLF
jgi:hypothetical protein